MPPSAAPGGIWISCLAAIVIGLPVNRATADVALSLVDHPGNPSDTTPSPPRGAVPYEFYIDQLEVSNELYVQFLSAVARDSDPNGLWNSQMESDPRGGIAR
jgi:hypothetical protein